MCLFLTAWSIPLSGCLQLFCLPAQTDVLVRLFSCYKTEHGALCGCPNSCPCTVQLPFPGFSSPLCFHSPSSSPHPAVAGLELRESHLPLLLHAGLKLCTARPSLELDFFCYCDSLWTSHYLKIFVAMTWLPLALPLRLLSSFNEKSTAAFYTA